MDPLTAVLVALTSAIAGALVTHMYRDYRDRPILKAVVESAKIARRPIALPESMSTLLKRQGNLKEWIEPRVKWKAGQAISENKFDLLYLRELHHLVPQFVSVMKGHKAILEDQLRSLAGTDAPAIHEVLASRRHWWLENFKEDLSMSYDKAPSNVIEQLKSSLNGDLRQTETVLRDLNSIWNYLDEGLSADAQPSKKIIAPEEAPTDPRKPFLIAEVMVMNSGKTQTLLKGDATLIVGDQRFPLTGITDTQTFDVFSGKYWKVDAHSVTEARFSQNPLDTTAASLQALADLIKDRRHSARIELIDFTGNAIATDKFALVDSV